jgi:hypothetical protein
MFMAGIFVVGAAVGLAATWWMNKSVDKPPTAPAVRKFEPAPPTPAPGGSGIASAPGTSGTSGTGGGPGTPMAGPTDGINPGELPYDGNPPGAGASVNAAPATALPPVQRVPDTEPKEPPRQAEGSRKTETARSAAKTDAQSEKPSAPVVTAAPPPAPPKKAEQSVAEAPEGPPAKTPPPAKPRETKVAKAPPRQQRTTAAIPKDKEIDRIRQQVDEELKKKIRAGDVTEAARSRTERADANTKSDDDASPRVAGQGSKRAALARCEREEDSLIGREICKWKVCSGMWGKHGCPSYERQVSVHY